ncbi:hypothetical protein PFISCL1PPCAC_20978, partial [Pristionchus fissidentatus]
VFRWEVDNVSKLTETIRLSPTYFFSGLPWYIGVHLVNAESRNNEPHLAFYLYCNEESECDLWRVEHKSNVVLINREDEQRNVDMEIFESFTREECSWGEHDLISFAEVMDPEEGFINDYKIIFEARIQVIAKYGMQKVTTFDFTQPANGWDNVALKIDGKNVYVCRRYLSIHSPYFTTLFFGEFIEKKQEEIELKDISHKEFIELLHVIYPSHRPVHKDSARFILKLADVFQIEYATNLAESYLIKSTLFTPAAKLLLADK